MQLVQNQTPDLRGVDDSRVSAFSHGASEIRGATTAACLSSEFVNPFLCDDWKHHQSGNGIHPPPTEECIQQQATQENPAKVPTEIRLFRIRVHSSAADLPA